MARMRMRRALIGVTLAWLCLAGCGTGKEPAPFKEVKQPATTTATPVDASAGDTTSTSISQLGAHYDGVFGQLINANTALRSAGDSVAAAANGAQALADHVATGYAAPSGSAPQVVRLRDALGSFSAALHPMLTSDSQLPRLSVELQVLASKLAKRQPRRAAALLTAKQQVDATIADVNTLEQAILVAQRRIRDQASKVTLDADALQAAITSATESTKAATSKVSAALSDGIDALRAASSR